MRIQRQSETFAYQIAALTPGGEHHGPPPNYPRSPQDWEGHKAALDQMLGAFRDRGIDSRSWHASPDPNPVDVGGHGHVYSPEREAQHQKIVGDYLPTIEAAPRQRKAVLMAGLGGAGKTTAVRQPWSRIDPRDVVIASDDIKEKMADRGMIPSVEWLAQRHPDLVPRKPNGELHNFSPLELSSLVQLESNDIAEKVASQAYRRGSNVVWDYRMGNQDGTMRKLKALARNGYHSGAFLVDVSPQRSRDAATRRHHEGQGQFYGGADHRGGRWLPSFATSENDPSPGSGQRSSSAEVFGQVTRAHPYLVPRGWAHLDNEDWGNPHVLGGAGEWEGMSPGTTPPRSAERRTAMNDPMYTDPESIYGLIERYRDQEFGFDDLVERIAHRFLEIRGVDRHPEYAGMSPYLLSEMGYDDDDGYWIEVAVTMGYITDEQAQTIRAVTGERLGIAG